MQLHCCCVTDNSSSQHHIGSSGLDEKNPQSYETTKRKLFRGFCDQHTDRQLGQTSSVMRKTPFMCKILECLLKFLLVVVVVTGQLGPDHLPSIIDIAL